MPGRYRAETTSSVDSLLRSSLPAGAEELLARYAAAATDRDGALYLSAPITSGRPLLDRLRSFRSSAHDRPSDPRAETPTLTDDDEREIIAANRTRLAPLREQAQVWCQPGVLVDPTTLDIPGWTQRDYHRFWVEVIARHASEVVFADGWEFSTGCMYEYAVGLRLDIPLRDATRGTLTPDRAAELLAAAANELDDLGRDNTIASQIARNARDWAGTGEPKDRQLARLSEANNTARFVSLASGTPWLRHTNLSRVPSRMTPLRDLVAAVLNTSRSGTVNVRTFRPEKTQGNPFHYGIGNVDNVVALINEAAAEGYVTIVNETIDVSDGGVSGVAQDGGVEFAPDATPRAVEDADPCWAPVPVAASLLSRVYGPEVSVPSTSGRRTEFSVHPDRVGFNHTKTLIWEDVADEYKLPTRNVAWPNRFSRMLGDKTFGLLVAEAFGASVPATTVITRRIAPFRFGTATGTGEHWIRTAPAEPQPGRYTTARGWRDPFELLATEDPERDIAAVLAQEGVDARWSGATAPTIDSEAVHIEGVSGFGDTFMLGERELERIPSDVRTAVFTEVKRLEKHLGPVRIEWVWDGTRVWIVQMHQAATKAFHVLAAGRADHWLAFDPADGLDALRSILDDAKQAGAGVEVTRPVGLTSHVGDLLRKAGVPGRFRSAAYPSVEG